jgi:uncharacterized protein (DUF1501 family)
MIPDHDPRRGARARSNRVTTTTAASAPLWRRRDVLRLGSIGALSCLLPGSRLWCGDPPLADAAPALAWERSLVLIELRGGNDGLNTVVPYAEDAYKRLRPAIHIPEDQLLALDDQFALHPALAPLLPAWQARDFGIAHGVGYEHPNRSHFRGIDIWNSASRADEQLGDGWAARVIHGARTRPAQLLADGIIFGYGSSVAYGGFGPLFGQPLRTIIMDAPQDYITQARAMPQSDDRVNNPALAHILQVDQDIALSASRMQALLDATPAPAGSFGSGGFASQLKHTAHLIAAGAVVPIYKLTLDGFDTHSNQRQRQDQLLAELAVGVAQLRATLIAAKAWDRTLVMTYSEFGRRVAENGSAGTDHGTAAPHFLLGGRVSGGHLSAAPSLRTLDDGDLVATTDFRSLYTTCVQEWWGYRGDFLSARGISGLGAIKTAAR